MFQNDNATEPWYHREDREDEARLLRRLHPGEWARRVEGGRGLPGDGRSSQPSLARSRPLCESLSLCISLAVSVSLCLSISLCINLSIYQSLFYSSPVHI